MTKNVEVVQGIRAYDRNYEYGRQISNALNIVGAR